MKKLGSYFRLTIFFAVLSCSGNAQVDISKLTASQWQEDLDYLVQRINKSFAGFTPETKDRFKKESEKLRNSLADLNPTQRVLEMARLLALLNDGHTELSLTGPAPGFHRLPLILYYFGQDLYLVGSSREYEKGLGSRVIKIEGHPVADVFEKLKPYVNHENDIEFITTAPYLMVIPEIIHAIGIAKSPFEVTFTFADESGIETDQAVKAVSAGEYGSTEFARVFKKAPLYMENPKLDYWYRFLPESKVMYVNIKSMFNQEGQSSLKKMIQEVFEQVDKTAVEKIVVDVRLCRGGNYNNALPLIEEIKRRPLLNKQGKVFIVNGRLTFSAAAVTTVLAKDQINATIIGEVSRARPNWGENMESWRLPNSNLKFDCTDELKFHSERLRNQDRIPVDIPIQRTFKRYQLGGDEVMDYIVSLK